MTTAPKLLHLLRHFVSFCLLLTILGGANPGLCQEKDSQCMVLKDKWERLHQELKEKLHGFVSIQQLPVDRIIQRPLVSDNQGKTIAKQIGDALQVKEDLLGEKRRDCLKIIDEENQVFEELQECTSASKNTKNKDFSSLQKNRRAVLDKIVMTLAEVKEVEGRETILPYSEAASQGDPYRQSVNNYWQNYQQMYRRWWGY
ncbi:MAG: hypothetical protein QG577_1154 [Thermodesulfobacteriota bacterium]|nr:hypothetical protein [Thermodesulfobacteriota bacterium]